MSKARLTATVLDRLHTLFVIVAGSLVGVLVMGVIPTNLHDGTTAADLIELGAALCAAYLAAFLADQTFEYAIRPVRSRLHSALAAADAKSASVAD